MASIRVVFNNEEVLSQELEKDIYVIGREATCDIHIDNLGISRAHSRLVKDGSTYCIEDLNSANGTFVNGQRVQRQHLNDGDEILIGKYSIVFSSDVQAQEAPAEVVIGAPGGGDALHTMAMDSEVVRKRIDDMRRERDISAVSPEPGAKAVPAGAAASPAGSAALEAELRAHKLEIDQLQGSLKTMRIMAAILGLAVVGLLIYLGVK